MQIKLMERGDIAGVVSLGQRNFSHPWREEEYLKTYQDSDKIYFVADEGGEIVASCAVWCSFEMADLCNIVVDERFRRQGVAGRMLASVLRECRRRGVERVLLEVRAGNAPAIALYEKFLFEKISLRKGYYRDPVEDGVVMQAVLL
jgi:ribosomal-protein-alanine N-acetyltransferase